jgi:MHS family proline/betaine transporter-like MFS transporter
VSRRALIVVGTSSLMLLSWPFFSAAQNMTLPLMPMFILASIAASFCTGTVIGVAADLFPTRIRFSGVAMSFNLSFTLLSGLAPVVATILARETGVPASAAFFMIGCAALSFIGALVMHRYDGQIMKDLAT